MTKLTFAIGLLFVFGISHVQAKPTKDLSQEFCGARYCGQVSIAKQAKIHRKHNRKATHKEKSKKAIQVASLDIIAVPGDLVEKAKGYLHMTARQIGVRHSLWCSAFIRKLTNATGVDDRAISWLNKRRIDKMINAIAVMRHHVGIVMGFTRNGDPILISGNHGHKVGIGVYPKGRVIAYVSPS